MGGRSGFAFEYQLPESTIDNYVPTLDSQESLSTVSATPWQVMGVGNVDRPIGQLILFTTRTRIFGSSETSPTAGAKGFRLSTPGVATVAKIHNPLLPRAR